jgi:uncharacterized protein (DUF885 family)
MGDSPTVTDLAEQHWNDVLRRSPSWATMLGDHRYDDQIEDVSEAAAAVTRAELDDIRTALLAIDPDALPASERTTYGVLQADLDMLIASNDQRVVEMQSDQMTGIHIDLLTSAPEIAAAEPEHAAMLVERNRKIPGLLEQAATRFRLGIERGRTPARVAIERSINSIDSYLASPLETDPFTQYGAPDDWVGETAWRTILSDVSRDAIRPAFQQLRDVLADELLPVARDDDHAGLSWLGDDGAALYDTHIRANTTLADRNAEELHAVGLGQLARLREEYGEIGSRVFGTSEQAEVFEHLLSDPALRYESPGEILLDAQTFIDTANAAAPEWFGRLPQTSCMVAEVPEFLAADAGSAYYFPPAPDGSRPGTYYVNTHRPEERTRYEAAAVGFHEAIPGHHFQLTIATEHDDLPSLQRLGLGNAAYVEGWALYAERLADEMGLYRDDIDRLGMLAGDSWRSCRLVVDTGLHAMGWTRQQAIDFMLANAPVTLHEIEVEIDRYIAMPGQALAYKVGQLEIERLRRDASDGLGAAFDLRAFHDAVIGSGTIPLPVLHDVIATAFPESPRRRTPA